MVDIFSQGLLSRSRSQRSAQPRYPLILDMLSARDKEFLLSRSTERTLDQGKMLYHQDDHVDGVYIILHGNIRVYFIYDGGASITFSYWRDGMIIGALGSSDWAETHSWTAQAVVETRVICLRRTDILELINASTDALKCFLEIIEFKAEQLKKVIKLLATPMVEERIFLAIRNIAELYGTPCGEGVLIDGKITHHEIAEMVGASRQRVTTLLQSLEDLGRIQRSGRRILLLESNPGRVNRCHR